MTHRNTRTTPPPVPETVPETIPVSETLAALIDATAMQVARAWQEVGALALRDAKLTGVWVLDVSGKRFVKRGA